MRAERDSAAEQLLDARGVGLPHGHGAGEATGLLARLDLEPVPQAGLLAPQLAAPGHLDPLRGPAVRLVLRNDSSVHHDAPGLTRGVDLDLLAAFRSVRQPFWAVALRAPGFLSGAITIVMFRPSCLGAASTVPSSATSSARRCNSRKPSSGRDCSRPRNMIVTLTLLPPSRKRTTLRFLVS